jgi:hypothetical protein
MLRFWKYFLCLFCLCYCHSIKADDLELLSQPHLLHSKCIEDCADVDKIYKHRLYALPEYFFTGKSVAPGVGVGYRFHEKRFGVDASIHGFPVSVCSSRGFLPFLKGIFLHYPSEQGLYLGFGADLGIITGPLVAIGYESSPKNELFLFAQLDGCYGITVNQGIASLAVGIGF